MISIRVRNRGPSGNGTLDEFGPIEDPPTLAVRTGELMPFNFRYLTINFPRPFSDTGGHAETAHDACPMGSVLTDFLFASHNMTPPFQPCMYIYILSVRALLPFVPPTFLGLA